MTSRAAGRVARGAALGGGGLAGLTAASIGVILAQARGVKREIGPQRAVPPYQDGRYGRRSGTSLRLAVLGDSVAAGLGADEARDTVGGILAEDLATALGRSVSLINHAVVGARSADLARQVTRALSAPPHLALIIIGANDVTHWVRPGVACAHLRDGVVRLQAAGAQVIVGTCPDLGTVRPVGPPLKWVARARSRQLAAAQDAIVRQAGGHPLSIGHLLGPEFEAHPEALFSPDRFHPSSLGYHRIAATLVPLARELVGAPPQRVALTGSAARAGGP